MLATSAQTFAQKTPLLDRALFFGNPQISGGQLSPDGKYISFLKEYDGIMNIWVKEFNEPFEAARPLTDSKRPLYGYFWTLDGKYILYVKDKDGDENINVFAVNPNEKAEAGEVPNSRNLTPKKDVTAQIYNVSDINTDRLMIGLNDRDKAWHDLYSLDISTGELKLVYENKDRIVSYGFDWEDNLRLLYRTDEKGNTTMLYKKGEELVPIYETSVTESAGAINWTPDNKKIYLVTNKGDLNVSTLFLFNAENKELTKIESDPENRVDFGNLRFDRNTREIISSSYTDDKTRIYWRNKEWEANYNFLKKKFPGREISFQSATKDYSKFLVNIWGDRFASESYFFDTKTKELILQYTPRPDLKAVEQHLAEMTPIRYKSSDGLEIPAYLSVPKGSKGKNLPLVVLVHGGPKGPRDYWGYDPQVQFLTNRGYAVLQPNFRASGGYGKNFLNAGDLQWGKLMQDDITWGVKHLIEKGVADKNKVAIMGGSYGGYATLAGLAFTPDLYACGVDIVGPSNIFTLLESVPAYWEAGRAFLYGMVGDPNTEEGKQRIKEASPLFSVDKIVKPLLIIQGANDPRVKKAEADQIAIAMRDRGKQVSYLLAEDEGHGFSKPVNRMAMYAEIEAFLAPILGGRFQDEMPDDVAKRLNELRVDISSVVYEPAKELASEKALPELKPAIKAGETSYKVSLEVQGQNIAMQTKRSVGIEEGSGNYIVNEVTSGPMGEIKDATVYNKSLAPLNRTVVQGGQTIKMNYTAEKVSVEAMGQKMDVALDGAFISSGAGMDFVVGALPLNENYSLVFAMLDMQSMKTKQTSLKVSGKEEVNGTSCWIVDLASVENPNEKTRLWINPTSKMAEKTEQFIPAMGNAKMTITKM